MNSAGAAKRYLPDDLDANAWHAAMDAKYFTYIHAMDAVLPGMAARSRGNVVNIIGMGGKVATPIHLPGGAANSALMLATVGLAQVYGPKGIRINAINPGATLDERVMEALRLEATARKITEDEVLAQGTGARAAAALCDWRGDRECRAVPCLRPGELCHRREHSDGRRLQSGDLTVRRDALPRSSRLHRRSSKSKAS